MSGPQCSHQRPLAVLTNRKKEIIGKKGKLCTTRYSLPPSGTVLLSSWAADSCSASLNRAFGRDRAVGNGPLWCWVNGLASIAIASDLRRSAAAFTAGSPYLLQLVGHYTCLYAEDGKVSEASLAEALRTSGDDFQSDVCATTLAALSERDVDFLEAMAELGEPTPVAAIAEAMGATVDYAQKYRRRLIDGGIIKSAGRGKVAFDVPFLAEHLRRRNE